MKVQMEVVGSTPTLATEVWPISSVGRVPQCQALGVEVVSSRPHRPPNITIIKNKNNMKKSVLVTLTACSAGGKSYLFDHIRDVAKLPCLISTTTRAPRANEVHGRDYYFIAEAESLELERTDQLAELANYNGVRYGVTKPEFAKKMESGLAFLIVEPTGIDHYAKPAVDAGALHYKVWIDVPLETRLKRFTNRAKDDIMKAALNTYTADLSKAIDTALKRQKSMLTEELTWFESVKWDRVLNGEDSPEKNLQIILDDLEKLNQ
jgi:guanylate kinase